MLITYLSILIFITGWLLWRDDEKQKAKIVFIIAGVLFIIGLGVCSVTL